MLNLEHHIYFLPFSFSILLSLIIFVNVCDVLNQSYIRGKQTYELKLHKNSVSVFYDFFKHGP